MSGFKRLLKNSLSNIINGFSNVILGIVISPVLLHNLSKVDFSIWSLTLQVGVLIGIFGIGLQVTVVIAFCVTAQHGMFGRNIYFSKILFLIFS